MRASTLLKKVLKSVSYTHLDVYKRQNSIRALVKHIKQLSDDEIMDVEIPNFPPLVFEFDEKLNVVKEYYLGK